MKFIDGSLIQQWKMLMWYSESGNRTLDSTLEIESKNTILNWKKDHRSTAILEGNSSCKCHIRQIICICTPWDLILNKISMKSIIWFAIKTTAGIIIPMPTFQILWLISMILSTIWWYLSLWSKIKRNFWFKHTKGCTITNFHKIDPSNTSITVSRNICWALPLATK